MSNDSEKQKVLVFTRQFRIRGYLNIYPGVRLTDYMNESRTFISITDAEVKHRGGEMVMKTKFLNVHRDDIEIIVPEDMVEESTRPL